MDLEREAAKARLGGVGCWIGIDSGVGPPDMSRDQWTRAQRLLTVETRRAHDHIRRACEQSGSDAQREFELRARICMGHLMTAL